MDDLSGLDWNGPQSKNQAPANKYNANYMSNAFASARPSPAPLLSSVPPLQPISRPSSTLNVAKPPGQSTSPANDSFSDLLSLKSPKVNTNLTLQDRQRQLIEEKRRQQAEQAQRHASAFGAHDNHVWEQLGSGKATPELRSASPAVGITMGPSIGGALRDDEADILAAFNSAAPVDRSSHFPPPTGSAAASGRNTPMVAQPLRQTSSSNNKQALLGDDDDDPFGLSALPSRTAAASQTPTVPVDDDDDFLGDLGKPVEASHARSNGASKLPAPHEAETTSAPKSTDPFDLATAELIDMGFTADRSRMALVENGGSVQAAVGWLLNQAHEESKSKSKANDSTRPQETQSESRASPQRRRRDESQEAVPAWMRQDARPSSNQRNPNDNGTGHEKDAAQLDPEIGTSLFKSANSLWKTGQKKMQKAVAEFQAADTDPNRPKWMRDASADSEGPRDQTRQEPPLRTSNATVRTKPSNMTDEAMMLDAPGQRGSSRSDRPASLRQPDMPQDLPLRSNSDTRRQQPAIVQDRRPIAELNRQEIEEQTAQAYISPARRKRPAQPAPQPKPEPEVDLFSSPAPVLPQAQPARSQPSQLQNGNKPDPNRVAETTTQPPLPKQPSRTIPPISSIALSSSAAHRKAGTEAFKRGDYDAAHTSYTAALTPLPPTHPLTIIVLSNRALTALKTGDPKAAVSDADRALSLIGPARGEGETTDLGGAEGSKDMKEFYGKALMRKAEAYEHMEKWSEAAKVWRTAVEAGVGGAVSLKARDRCEKAVSGGSTNAAAQSVPRPASAPPKKAAARPLAASRPAVAITGDAEAVRKLREANAAAEKADDEKFALVDQVDARLTAWKGGKSDNLRALLASLDTVLWPEAGWKKVGMADLVMPNKVKIIYMKAIAKVHPDKISQTATTEQRMISGAVFSTLNEAWDKFKKDNGL